MYDFSPPSGTGARDRAATTAPYAVRASGSRRPRQLTDDTEAKWSSRFAGFTRVTRTEQASTSSCVTPSGSGSPPSSIPGRNQRQDGGTSSDSSYGSSAGPGAGGRTSEGSTTRPPQPPRTRTWSAAAATTSPSSSASPATSAPSADSDAWTRKRVTGRG
ncbi:hypothetical protein [Streptomyces californicus]